MTTQMLKQWAMATAFQFLDDNFKFNASDHWIKNFKNNISQRGVTKYIGQKDRSMFEELLNITAQYQLQTSNMITNFNPNYVIYTDQTECEYKISSNRTLTHKDEKITEIAVQLNKLTHLYSTIRHNIIRKIIAESLCLPARSYRKIWAASSERSR